VFLGGVVRDVFFLTKLYDLRGLYDALLKIL
jgi:hypothetical protein